MDLSLLFRNFIEQISDALDDLHEHDQDHDGVCHYIGAKALKTVADRHVAEPAAADRARHRRKSDDDDECESNRADDARQRLDEHYAKDNLRLARTEALRRLDHAAIDLQQRAFDEASDKGRRADSKRHNRRGGTDTCANEELCKRKEHDQQNYKREASQRIYCDVQHGVDDAVFAKPAATRKDKHDRKHEPQNKRQSRAYEGHIQRL